MTEAETPVGELRMLIDGQLVEARSGATFDNINPATEGALGPVSDTGIAIAKRVKAGVTGVNGGMFYGADAPFGGYKSSGVWRQNGLEGFAQYTETKVIAGPASS